MFIRWNMLKATVRMPRLKPRGGSPGACLYNVTAYMGGKFKYLTLISIIIPIHDKCNGMCFVCYNCACVLQLFTAQVPLYSLF